jgi:hypothetical protein
MRSRFTFSISAAALLASVALGAAARAADQADVAPATGDYNTDNGVHAAPSGHVAAQGLAAIGKTARTPTPTASPTHSARHDEAPARVIRIAAQEPAPSSLNWLSHSLAAAPPGVVLPVPAETPAAPQAEAAPAPAEPSAADPAPPSGPLAQVDAPATATPAVAVVESASGDAAAPEVVSASAAAAQDADDAPAGHSEEDAVYRRTADVDADAAPLTAEPIVERVGEARRSDQGMGQHVAFPRGAAEAAGAFDGYMRAVAAIDAGFTSGQGVAEALQKAAAYDPRQLEEGMISYGAMAAMQSARFVYGVMDIASDPRGREDLVERLISDPGAASRLPGAGEAAALASLALKREARPVVASGYAIKQAAYDVQHQRWSIAQATDQRGRLARAKALSRTPVATREGDIARVIRQISDLDTRADAADGGITPVAAHSLALAALAILDEAGGSDPVRLAPVTTEQVSAYCLKMAKLNLFQCLSVAGPEYEDIYCLGQHAVLDTGQCVAGESSPRGAAMMSYNRANRARE